MSTTIAVIAAMAEKKKFSDLSDNDCWDRTLYISAILVAAIAGEWFHMIAKIAAIAEVFIFSSVIAAITAMVRIIWKACFNLIVAYYKRKDCLQRNLYLNCVSLWKKPWRLVIIILWSISISAVVWSSMLISVTWVELLWAVYKFFRIT